MTPFGHAETRAERAADWVMFVIEVYLLLAILLMVGGAFFGFMKLEYARGFRAGMFFGIALPLVAYWVYHDFRAMRSGLAKRAGLAKAHHTGG
jgi:hypothetical protein